MNALELKNISKNFGKQSVINGVSFKVKRSEVLVIFATSGSGKTVLLRMIAGVENPDEGQVLINGTDCTQEPPNKRFVGMAFQNFALFPHMNAFKNIQSALDSGTMSNKEKRNKVKSLAELLKIDHVLEHTPKELSNGQKQRVSLARALVGNPQILILDDPLRNIDAKLRFEMRMELPPLLKSTNSTVIYVTQDYKEAMALADNIAVLIKGTFIQIDSPEMVYAKPKTIEVAKLFGDPTINLINVTPQRSAEKVIVSISGSEFEIGQNYAKRIGTSCILGIRPHHLQLTAENSEGGIPANLIAVTPIGLKSILLLRLTNNIEILASIKTKNKELPQNCRFQLDCKNILLFDKISGNLIEPDTLK